MEEKKSRFLATITHELKSPLHGIIGLSDSLGVNAEVSEAVRKPLGMIKSCASRLLDMVTNMMDASVLVHDKKMRLSVDDVSMEALVEEVILLCRHSIDKRGKAVVKESVQLINAMPASLPVIQADAHRCTQLVYNLITNALKFTHVGFVKVSADADDENEQLTVHVQDTGIGIAKENIQRIFQPFDQEDQSETRQYEGLGLGLAISCEVAEKHGGRITVDSKQGQGSTFHVTLPYKSKTQELPGELVKDAAPKERIPHGSAPGQVSLLGVHNQKQNERQRLVRHPAEPEGSHLAPYIREDKVIAPKQPDIIADSQALRLAKVAEVQELEQTNASLMAEVKTLKRKSDMNSASETRINALEADKARLTAEVAKLMQQPVQGSAEVDEATRIGNVRLVEEKEALQRELSRYKELTQQRSQESHPTLCSPYESDSAAEFEKVTARVVTENNILKGQQLRYVQQIEQLKLKLGNDAVNGVKDKPADHSNASQWPIDQHELQAERSLCWRLFYETKHLKQDLQIYSRKIAKIQSVARDLHDRLQLSESRNEALTYDLRKLKIELNFWQSPLQSR
jgi:hypothetical protein